MRWSSLLLLPAAWLASPSLAVFADDAYVSDYHLALLGLPQEHTTFFHQPYANSKASLLYTLTDRALLGAVNPKDGSVVWRQALSSSFNGSDVHLVAGAAQDLVVSASGNQVAAWAAGDGRLAWSKALTDGASARGLAIAEAVDATSQDSGKDVFLLYHQDGSRIERLDGITGNTKWVYSDKSDTPFKVCVSPTHVHLVSLHDALIGGMKIKVTSLDLATGHKIDSYSLSSDSDVSSPEQILYPGVHHGPQTIAWKDKSSKTLKINFLGIATTHSLAIENDTGNEIERISLHAAQHADAETHFLVHYQTRNEHWADVYHAVMKPSPKISKAYYLPRLAGDGAFTCSMVDANVYFTRVTSSEMTLVSSASHGILGRWDLLKQIKSAPPGSLSPVHVTAEVAASSGSSYPIRAAVLSSTGDWSMIRNGELSWSRPEYLTRALTAVFVDVPEEQSLARELEIEGHQNVLAAFVHRLKRHMHDLQYLSEVAKRLLELVIGSNEDSIPAKDKFGFQKLAVVALDAARLVALETLSGKPLWSSDIPSFTKWSADNVPELRMSPDGSIEVWERSSERPCVVNVTDGKVISEPEFNEDNVQTYPLPGTGPWFDRTKRGLRAFQHNSAGSLWQFTVPAAERVVSVAARQLHDPVASIGKVLGDRRVLYKYLNPNIALVSSVNDATGSLTVTLLDTASGLSLYATTHRDVDTSKAVVSTVSENWFAYAYTLYGPSSDSRGHQIAIAELYESPFPNDRGPLGSSGNYSTIGGAAQDQALPHVISQTFATSEEISHMSVTQTRQGITSRALLVTLAESNGIVAIPRHFLDARRPVGRDPTPSEAAEGLIRYMPTLEFDPKWYLNHQREVLGVKNVVTSPSLLESTSLVFAYGIDVFGTRVSPSFTFDILGKGFNKVQMLLTVAALGVAVFAVKPLVRKKQINQRWQVS